MSHCLQPPLCLLPDQGCLFSATLQRKREDAAAAASSSVSRKKKPLDPAELEAQAKREAARQRVQQRTMSSFGLT